MFSVIQRSAGLRQLTDLDETVRRETKHVNRSESIAPKAEKSEHIYENRYNAGIFHECCVFHRFAPRFGAEAAVLL